MPKGDDILLGATAALSTDSDGDGISDAQERLEGTDPGDASDYLRSDPTLNPDVTDPRADVERATIERETAFDPTANMPEGMSVDSGLKGLTNLDGTSLSTGADHFGIGADSLLAGRLGANSPLDMLKDPAGGSGQTGAAGPAGADLGSRGPNWDLLSGEGDTKPDEFELPGAIKPTDTPPPPMSDPPSPPPDAERQPPPPPKPDGVDPDPDPEPGPTPLQTDPDAGGNSGVNVVGGGGVPLDIDGPRVVEGYGGTPQIEGDAPPVRYIDLVTDGGGESAEADTSGVTRGSPDAPVIHTINPDAGVLQPPISGRPPGGGGGGGDDFGLYGSSSAATAATAEAPDAPGISLAGSGGGTGIASVAPEAETPDLVADVRDGSVTPVGNVGAQHSAPDAVDQFATEYLQDASLDAPANDFAAAGLTADLDSNLVPIPDDIDSRFLDDLDVDSPEGFTGLDTDDALDP